MLLLIDNFDSFTYNLVQCFQTLGVDVKVIRNNSMNTQDCLDLRPTHLVISPGPGHPGQSGISKELIQCFAGQLPILGVCLGHQCIGEIYGGKVVRAKQPMHGKLSAVKHDEKGLFAGIPQNFTATRYHSLIIERATLPACLHISAETEDGEIMGLRHHEIKGIEGVQFHPESIMTQEGKKILSNFLKL
jgi:anthranilate synthase/aminodeoxychorismate synthase-like glutamine amidotransferase